MNKKNVHRYIEEQNAEEKENLRKMTEEKLGFSLSPETAQNSVTKTKKVQKWATVFATVACAVCLLIALPFLLKHNAAPKDQNRYCEAGDYVVVMSDCTLQEYNERNGQNLLYVDRYAQAAEIVTQICVSETDENDIIFFYEIIYLEDTYEGITLYITDTRTTVDILVLIDEKCGNKISVDNIQVRWNGEEESTSATFTYQGHNYFLVLEYPVTESDLTQMISDML